jgi:hypothetical protein
MKWTADPTIVQSDEETTHLRVEQQSSNEVRSSRNEFTIQRPAVHTASCVENRASNSRSFMKCAAAIKLAGRSVGRQQTCDVTRARDDIVVSLCLLSDELRDELGLHTSGHII